MNQTQLLDVVSTISVYMESNPQLFSNEDQSIVMSAVWNSELNEEGHTVLGLILDPIRETLTVVESDSHSYPLYGKYTLSGIAASNGLAFEVIETNECISCTVGEDVANRTADSESDQSTDKPLLH